MDHLAQEMEDIQKQVRILGQKLDLVSGSSKQLSGEFKDNYSDLTG